MSKNSYRPGVNQYANQEEARRKARGNPNKNVHQKKKNSNYAGYAGNPVTQKIIEKANQQERVKLPTWLNIWLAVLFAAIIVVLILRLAVYKDSILLSSLSSLLLGIESPVYKIITVVLTVCGVIYTFMGAVGLLSLAGIL